MTAEEYIKAYTRGCSNELVSVEDRFGKKVISYREWLTPENALTAVELAREEFKESIIKMLDAEKEDTGIGLCEYDAGHENGRMEIIDSLIGKIRDMSSNRRNLNT